MKYLVDAQLPKSLSDLLNQLGKDSIHTLDLPEKNFSKDNFISELSIKENRILVTKDSDFLDSYLLLAKPEKLILVKTGNINNAELLNFFKRNISEIEHLLRNGNLLEINREAIVLHK